MNFPLHAALVKVLEERSQTGTKVQYLQGEGFTLRESAASPGIIGKKRAQLDVLPLFAVTRTFEPIHYLAQVLRTGKWLAVIRKGERDETVAANPTANAAEGDAVRELFPGWRGGIHDRFVAVGTAQSFKPVRSVAYRTMRMTLHQPLPTPDLNPL